MHTTLNSQTENLGRYSFTTRWATESRRGLNLILLNVCRVGLEIIALGKAHNSAAMN